jgi:hypothetical protein
LILGVLLYPLFYGVGRLYIRLAEQGERDFMGIVNEGVNEEAEAVNEGVTEGRTEEEPAS